MKVEDRLETFLGQKPTFEESCFVAPTATVVGDVRVGSHSSIWYGCVLRGDINYISIGESSNL